MQTAIYSYLHTLPRTQIGDLEAIKVGKIGIKQAEEPCWKDWNCWKRTAFKSSPIHQRSQIVAEALLGMCMADGSWLAFGCTWWPGALKFCLEGWYNSWQLSEMADMYYHDLESIMARRPSITWWETSMETIESRKSREWRDACVVRKADVIEVVTGGVKFL
jgi:hypothetical protein